MSYKNLEIEKLTDELMVEIQGEELYDYLRSKLETSGKKINLFIKGVDNTDRIQQPATSNQQPVYE